jgi:hypothetical protein
MQMFVLYLIRSWSPNALRFADVTFDTVLTQFKSGPSITDQTVQNKTVLNYSIESVFLAEPNERTPNHTID